MKLIVAGVERSKDLGARLSAAARAMPSSDRLDPRPPQVSAFRLRDARDEADYARLYAELARQRLGLSTAPFAIPRRPGPAGILGNRIKFWLWKLLRYQHDRMAHQQNGVNELLGSSLQWLIEENVRLRAEVEKCKRAQPGRPEDPAP
jgi:hypothetical protein